MAANPKQADTLIPDLDQAERFLSLLDPEAEEFTFQVLPEASDGKGGKRGHSEVFQGPFDQFADILTRAQSAGCYIGVMVNEGDGITHPPAKTCRSKASVKRVRAIFQEDDGDGKRPPLEPHIEVESSPGKFHRYWLVEGLSKGDFTAVMKVMVDKYGSDKAAKDLARVLRLPGFYHQKGEPFLVWIVHESGGLPYTRDQIMEAFQPEPVHTHQAPPEPEPTNGKHVTPEMIARAKRPAIDAAIRTRDNLKLPRHDEIYQLGHCIRRDLLKRGEYLEQADDLLIAALKTFEADMRPTDTSGVIAPMNWDAELETIRAGYLNRGGEPDRPGTRKGDFDDVQFGEVEDEPEAANDPLEKFPDPFPGFMAEVVSRALETAPKPQPDLTTLAVLVGMAGAIGGHYHLPDGMRLNLYGIGVADTGEGKDRPQQVAKAIVKESGAQVIGKPGSGQGLEDAISDYAPLFITQDEVAHWFEAINGRNKMPYLIELAAVLLKLFSSSAETYYTRQLANIGNKGTQTSRAVEHPSLSLLGFSTPQKLGESLTTANIEDGLVGRMLMAVGLPEVTPRRVKHAFAIGDRTNDARAVGESQAQVVGCGSGEFRTRRLIEIQIEPSADDELDRMLGAFDAAKKEPNVTQYAKAIYARSYEKAARVAGVLAVWDSPASPVVTTDHVNWAEALVKASNSAMIWFAGTHLHNGLVQANAAKVKDVIGKIVSGRVKPRKSYQKELIVNGKAPRALCLKATHLSNDEFSIAVKHLAAMEEIVVSPEGEEGPAWLRRVA